MDRVLERRDKSVKILMEVENKFPIPLSHWRSKKFALMRGSQIWSENWVWIIYDKYFGRKALKIDHNRNSNDFLVVIRPPWGSNIFQTQFWDNIFNPLINANILDPNMKAGLKIYWVPLVLSKFYLWCANQRSIGWRTKEALVFIWEKLPCFVTQIPCHRISSESLEKVEFGAKWNALMTSLTNHNRPNESNLVTVNFIEWVYLTVKITWSYDV